MIKFTATTILGMTLATAVSADIATLSKPIQAGSLHEGPLDMVAYYVPIENEAFEVTATFIGRLPGDQPMRIVMKLEEGDDVSFAMPGYHGAQYQFERSEGVVDVSVDLTANRIAAR